MRSLTIIFYVVLVLFSLQQAQARIIHVPAEQPTIGSGIGNASRGDTVLVSPGIYNETVFLINDSAKVLASEFIMTGDTNTIYNTIVQGSILINNVQDTNLIISGFTITNPSTASMLPGIYGTRCCPLICHNRIMGNNSSSGYNYGGGIEIYDPRGPGMVRIISNTITSNIGILGGGIALSSGSGLGILIKDNLIAGNQGGMGGGIYSYGSGFTTIEENLIFGNVATNGGAVCCSLSHGALINNTISDNAGAFAGGIYCNVYYSSTLTIKNNIISHSIDGAGVFYKTPSKGEANDKLLIISYNDCWGNADGNYGGSCPDLTGLNGNISQDPVFCDRLNGNYFLSHSSPCLGSGESGSNMGAFGVGCGWVDLSPGADQIGAANTTVPVYFYIENQGDSSESFVLDASDDLAWTLQPSHFELTLNSGQTDTIELVVSIPDVPFGTADTVTLKAVSQSNPLNSDSASLVVTCKVYDVDILDISDIDNDQGKQVRTKWTSFPGSDPLVTDFTIFRRIDPLLSTPLKGAQHAFPLMDYPPGEWDIVGTCQAFGETLYSVVVPTLKDSTIAEGMYWSIFFVRAGTANPIVYFDSPVDSGYSLDNLSPSPPTGLLASHAPAVTKLTWRTTPIPDFDYHTVYRDTIPGFTPSLSNRVGFTIDTTFVDSTAQLGRTCYYLVTATDFSGNESDPSNEAMGLRYITGDANTDGQINSADVVYLINYLFIGGPPPTPLVAGDANCDGKINASDIVYLINYLFIGGPAPCEP